MQSLEALVVLRYEQNTALKRITLKTIYIKVENDQ